MGKQRLNDRSPLGRLVTVSREFGLSVAMRVTYSKLRGKLWPALALPDVPVYDARRREVSLLLSTAEQDVATVDAVVKALAAEAASSWEACICERSPAEPEMARVLARLRGTQRRIRIVTTDGSVDDATAARWTVEQATGQFVALVAPGYVPEADVIVGLLDCLRNAPETEAVALVATESLQGCAPIWAPPTQCRLLLQRKSGYLAASQGPWPLTAPALATLLCQAHVPTAYVAA